MEKTQYRSNILVDIKSQHQSYFIDNNYHYSCKMGPSLSSVKCRVLIEAATMSYMLYDMSGHSFL